MQILMVRLLRNYTQNPSITLSFFLTLLSWICISFLSYLFIFIIFRKIFRKIPGEIDDIVLTILAKPVLICIVLYGIVDSLFLFHFSDKFTYLLTHITNTILIIVGTFVMYRIIKEVIIRFGQTWANNTESRVDDIVVPVVNIFGTLFLVLFSLLLTLSYWGFNITSLLVSAGVASFIIGLALQDNLSNMFSGINLIMDAPFKINDVIVLANGKICKVEKFGLRATQLYDIDEQVAVFIPNKDLSNSVIINITKPTVDLKVCLEIGVGYKTDLNYAKQILENIAIRHPNVLVGQTQIKKKIEVMKQNNQAHHDQNYMTAIKKLETELLLNEGILTFENDIKGLIKNICSFQKNGIESNEKEILKKELPGIEKDIFSISLLLDQWTSIKDPWIDEGEFSKQMNLFEQIKIKFMSKWENLKKELLSITYENEAMLLLKVQDFKDWLNSDFKQVHGIFKDPSISFKTFGASSVSISLDFYIDDILLEHYDRKQRVVREVAFEMLEQLIKANIEIPCQQVDVTLKSPVQTLSKHGM